MCRARNPAWICNRFSQRKGPCHGHAGALSAPAERLSGREQGVTSRANLSLAAFAWAYIGRALASGCHWHQMSAARWDARSPLTTASGCLIPKSNCKLPRASKPAKACNNKVSPALKSERVNGAGLFLRTTISGLLGRHRCRPGHRPHPDRRWLR